MLRSAVKTARLSASCAIARPSTSQLLPTRTFLTTSPSLAKAKSRRNDASDDVLGGSGSDPLLDEADDLFGAAMSSLPSSSSLDGTRTSSTASSPKRPRAALFKEQASELRRALEPDSLRAKGQPRAALWRQLVSLVKTKSELLQAADIAATFARLPSPSLSPASSQILVAQAVQSGHAEVALDLICNRHTTHIDHSLTSLRSIQHGLSHKLSKAAGRAIVKSADSTHKPTSLEPELAAALAGLGEAPSGEGEATKKKTSKHGSLPVVSAKLSLIDRMCIVAGLSSTTTATTALKGSEDPFVVSLLLSTLVKTFRLAESAKSSTVSPAEAKLYARADAYLLHLLRISKAVLDVGKRSEGAEALEGVRLSRREASRFLASLETVAKYAAWRKQHKDLPVPAPTSAEAEGEGGEKQSDASATPAAAAPAETFPPRETFRTLYTVLKVLAPTTNAELERALMTRVEPVLQGAGVGRKAGSKVGSSQNDQGKVERELGQW